MAHQKNASQRHVRVDKVELADLNPYTRLAGAFIARMLDDARGNVFPNSLCPETKIAIKEEAQHFLQDHEAVAFWCELVGADVDKIRPVLLRTMQK